MALLDVLQEEIDDAIGRHIVGNWNVEGLELVRNSCRHLYVATGRLSGVYGGERFAQLLRQRMDTFPNYNAEILFFKAAVEQATRLALKRDNPGLYSLFDSGKYMDRLKLYWARRRPSEHFMIADNDVLLEAPHIIGEPSLDVLILRDDTPLAEKQSEKFDDLLEATDEKGKIAHLLVPSGK